jgi:hypothetical protein
MTLDERKRLPDQARTFQRGKIQRRPIAALSDFRDGRADVFRRIKMTSLELALASQAAMVGMLEEPDADGAAGGVEFRGRAENRHEHDLNDLFSFGCVAQYAFGDSEDEGRVAIEQNGNGIVTSGNKAGYQLLVGLVVEPFPGGSRPARGRSHAPHDFLLIGLQRRCNSVHPLFKYVRRGGIVCQGLRKYLRLSVPNAAY